MIGRMQRWFLGRSRREQQLLLAMTALAAVVLVWAVVILPVTDQLAASRERYADAVVRLGDTRARLQALKVIRGARQTSLGGALDADLRARAEGAGFTLSQVTMQGRDSVHITIASARTGSLFGWVAGLEDAGLVVDSLGVTDNGDGTVAVQMTVRTRN